MTFNPHTHRVHRREHQSGIALVLTLSLIVLVTMAAVAFLTRATANRSVETSRTNQILAAQLAESGADYTISTFLQEIITTSTPSTDANGNTNFYPTSGSSNMVPTVMLPDPSMTNDANVTNFASLIRPSWANALETNASSDSSATPSKNGRIVSMDRWNAPMLCPNGFASTNQLPSWVYVNQDGGLSKVASSNTIGRFAYNAYDIGGLLDANVAGYFSNITNDPVSGANNLTVLKGTLAGADLSVIPGVESMDAFVSWRNMDYIDDPGGYVSAVTNGGRHGFLKTVSGGKHFTSRQDLIRLASNGTNGITTNALPYLTHYTRELARPSIAMNGLNTMTQRYDLSQWSGDSPPAIPSSIPENTLSTINPDFFEVLKSAISFTNSWETAGPNQAVFDASSAIWAADLNLQAMAIGADIIDQFRTNVSTPTFVTNGSYITAGKKEFPYLKQLLLVYSIDTDGGTPATYTLNFSILPQAWCMNANSVGFTVTASGSGKLSVVGAEPPVSPVNLAASGVPVDIPAFSGVTNVFSGAGVNPASDGFFGVTNLTFQNTSTNKDAPPMSFTVDLSGISFVLSTPEGKKYFAFGSDPTGSVISATIQDQSFSFPIDTNALPSGNLGKGILAHDPRTLRDAGDLVDYQDNASMDEALTSTTVFSNIGTNLYQGVALTNSISLMHTASRINGVGELGYVFRESPGRNIDFISGSGSADRGLLDVLSAYPTPSRGVRAGVLNLNTRQTNVLAAVLTNSPTVMESSTNYITNTATIFAASMASYTATNPLTNRAQLVDLVFTNVIADVNDMEKASRESAIRALGEIGQVRTWNLLIDVVAQSGKFAGTNTAATNFIVGGEERTWTSIAIDRFTGKVIDRQTEQVEE